MPGNRRFATGSALLAVAILAGCGDSPTAPAPCEATPVLSVKAVAHVSDATVAAAVGAAAVWAEALPAAAGDSGRLEAELLALLGAADDARSCRAVRAARELLGRRQDDASTAPARAAIELTLDVVETYLAARP